MRAGCRSRAMRAMARLTTATAAWITWMTALAGTENSPNRVGLTSTATKITRYRIPKPSRASTCVLPLSPKAIHRASTPGAEMHHVVECVRRYESATGRTDELCPEEPEHADRDQDDPHERGP